MIDLTRSHKSKNFGGLSMVVGHTRHSNFLSYVVVFNCKAEKQGRRSHGGSGGPIAQTVRGQHGGNRYVALFTGTALRNLCAVHSKLEFITVLKQCLSNLWLNF